MAVPFIPYVSYYLVGGAHQGGLNRVATRQKNNMIDAWVTVGYWTAGATKDDARAKMVRSVDRAVNEFGIKHVFFALNGQNASDMTQTEVKANLLAMYKHRHRIPAIELADEPAWTNQQTKDNLKMVREKVAKLWPDRPVPPIGIMYTPEQVRDITPGGAAMTIAPPVAGGLGADFIGFEAYNNRLAVRDGKKAPWDMGAKFNRDFVRQTLSKGIARVHPMHRLQITFQGFDRNGFFVQEDGQIHEENLAALQKDTWEIVKTATWGPRVDYVRIFNWARWSPNGFTADPGDFSYGSGHYFKLQEAQRAMISEIRAAGGLV